MNLKVKGTILGIVSAVSYGTNPLGALFLYQEGLNSNSVLFYRFSLAAVVLACILFIQKQSFKLSRKEVKTLCLLGILFAVSSLTFYTSFHHMDAGIASTLLFVYPIMVAVIMSLFFKERISPVTMFSIILALSGIALLYRGGTGAGLNGLGVSLVMIASIKLTFYVLLFCMVAIVFHSFFDGSNYLQPLTTPRMWLFAIMLALVPTVISLVTMTMAVHAIGSTPTAIMGALEPLTAVIIGVTVFGEIFTLRLGIGIFMILVAVILIVAAKSFSPRKIVSFIGHVVHTVPVRRK